MKKPSLRSLLLGLIPFIAICFCVPLWDRICPTVFGLPFNFFWLISWLFLTPACLWAAFRLDTHPAKSSTTNQAGHP